MRPLQRPDRRAWLLAGAVALAGAPARAADAPASAPGAEPAAPAADAIAAPRTLRVGPSGDVATVAEAAQLARSGDTVEIAAGEYRADVAVWRQDRLTIRAVGGRARLVAAGAHAEGKAIWVFKGGAVTIEGIEFTGTRVPDRNGAGIRFERGQLTVRNCRFLDNESGILTGNDPQAELTIEGSEFGHNGAGDGYSHNLYVGMIRRLVVTGSWFHHGRKGHLLKSRAAESRVLYSRLVDEADGQASYEAEFPNGGVVTLVGNLIGQGPQTDNPYMLAFGMEGYKWPDNRLMLVHNTFVDERRPSGYYLRVRSGAQALLAYNNLLSGVGVLEGVFPDGRFGGNAYAPGVGSQDGRSRQKLPAVVPLPAELPAPDRQYVHPLATRPLVGPARSPGAAQ